MRTQNPKIPNRYKETKLHALCIMLGKEMGV